MTTLFRKSLSYEEYPNISLQPRDSGDGDLSSSGLLGRADSPRGIYHKRHRIVLNSHSKKGRWVVLIPSILLLLALWFWSGPRITLEPKTELAPEPIKDDHGEIPWGQSRDRGGREVFWWEQFAKLHGFYRGRKTVIPLSANVPESFDPNTLIEPSLSPVEPAVGSRTLQCYLDDVETTPAPTVSAIIGVPRGMSTPLFGSHQELGLRNDVCYDRFTRFAQYGLDASEEVGGTGHLTEGDSGGRHQSNRVDWHKIKWRDAQERCLNKNRDRVRSRTAIVIRTWNTFTYTPFRMLMLRAMINELSLLSGGQYTIHFLIHVQDVSIPIWASEEIYNQTLRDSLPAEFEGMGTLWSVDQMRSVYPPPFPDSIVNFSGGDVYDAYRSLHFPLQYFASKHPEYDYFWQWEMDIRVTGHYLELLQQITQWAESQPRDQLWEQSSQFYIPELYNNSYSRFSETVKKDTIKSGQKPISGPQMPTRSLFPIPHQHITTEITDLITFNPIFNPERTRWAFHDDITGYNDVRPRVPTRASLITASRLSRRLLLLMHEETYHKKHTMFPEMYPASIALHYGLKAVYAPLPVYFERQWPAVHANEIFNNAPITPESRAKGMPDHGGGTFHDVGGSVFGPGEHVFRGSTYYTSSGFAGYLWRRWLGRQNGNGEPEWESEGGKGGGRMCLPMMVLHPIKSE